MLIKINIKKDKQILKLIQKLELGRSIGYSVYFLIAGAGTYQLKTHWKNPTTYINCFTTALCDDPRDTYYIKMGAIQYDNENSK